MTQRQREMARHALGLPNDGMCSNRNHFLAEAPDEMDWRAMVRAGYAKLGAPTDLGQWFALTRAGARAAVNPGEGLDHIENVSE